jgi:polysaccharide biosynthesis transport protein
MNEFSKKVAKLMSLLLVLQVLRQRLWLLGLSLAATVVGAIFVLLLVPARYDAIASASIDPSITDPVSGTTAAANSIGIMQGNLIALAKSNQVALAVVGRLNMDSDPASRSAYQSSSDSGLVDIRQWLASQIGDHVDAKFGIGSNVLNVTYKASSPQQAALLSNAFMSSFIDAAIALKGQAGQKAAAWYEPQIENIRNNLATSREKLARFQAESKLLTSSNATGDVESDQLMAATSDLTKAKADLVALQNQLNAPPQTAAVSNESQSIDLQTLGALRGSLSNVETEIARTQLEVGANNPKLQEKIALRQSLQKQMQAAIDDYHKKLTDRIAQQRDRVTTLQKVYDDRLDNMINVQGQRETLVSLVREVSFHQEELERLQRAASQARLQSQLSFSNIALMDAATPPTTAAFPKPMIVLPLAIGAGVAIGVLLALIAESLNRKLRTEGDLAYVANAPLLGMMPSIRPKQTSRWSRLVGRLRQLRLPRPGRPKTDGALAGS